MGEVNLSSIHKKEKITDQVLGQLKNALMRGELKPGDRLPGASELASTMGVGISSVREAIKMLESLGAVEARQGEGTFVCTTLREGVADAFEIQFMLLPRTAEYLVQFREMYETAYTVLALRNAEAEDLAKVEAVVLAQEEKLKSGSGDGFVDAGDEMDFHRSVLYCTHNPYVIKIGEVSLELFFDVASQKLEPLTLRPVVSDHRAIYEALLHKDQEKLREVFERCFPKYYDRLKSGK
ncbi:GntR family transcriptional regulator [Spirochaetia bacterium]|nr:GntR family transcriptional regulator [Spirochaetia bacterium]